MVDVQGGRPFVKSEDNVGEEKLVLCVEKMDGLSEGKGMVKQGASERGDVDGLMIAPGPLHPDFKRTLPFSFGKKGKGPLFFSGCYFETSRFEFELVPFSFFEGKIEGPLDLVERIAQIGVEGEVARGEIGSIVKVGGGGIEVKPLLSIEGVPFGFGGELSIQIR